MTNLKHPVRPSLVILRRLRLRLREDRPRTAHTRVAVIPRRAVEEETMGEQWQELSEQASRTIPCRARA
jgi:hypothetical protein